MLARLHIQNYALIEEMSMDFTHGFSIITGETGAGKSILLDALGLLMGKRADLSALRSPEQKCVVEGTFAIGNYALQALFAENDWDYEQETVIRREILPSGKSRAFINDTPATLSDLTTLSTRLIDIHSQHQTLGLNEQAYQFEVVDAVAGVHALVTQFNRDWASYKKDQQALEHAQNELVKQLREHDFNQFLLNELEEANIQIGQQAEWEALVEQGSHAELLVETLTRTVQTLDTEQIGVLAQLNELKSSLQKVRSIAPVYEEFATRIESTAIEVKELISDLENQIERIDTDPAAWNAAQEKLQRLYQLQQKHRVNSEEELVAIQADLAQKTAQTSELEQEIERLTTAIAQKEQQLHAMGAELHQKRSAVLASLQDEIQTALRPLGMPHAQLQIELTAVESFNSYGTDQLQWLFSANKGGRLEPLKKVASGGELSRVMLVVKAILARYQHLPTLLFDEIDTGVSGEIADKMGEIMVQLSQYLQLFAITHLPQIAAKGDVHYQVKKDQSQATTTSKLVQLSNEERTIAIATMLSGANLTETALSHARALLQFH